MFYKYKDLLHIKQTDYLFNSTGLTNEIDLYYT